MSKNNSKQSLMGGKSLSQELLADFNLRKSGAANAVCALQLSADEVSEYIPVHRFADEILDKEEAAGEVDCFWRVGGQVFFAQTVSARMSTQLPGFYCRRDRKSKPEMIYLLAVVLADRIHRNDVELALSEFARIGVDKISEFAETDRYFLIRDIAPQPAANDPVARREKRTAGAAFRKTI